MRYAYPFVFQYRERRCEGELNEVGMKQQQTTHAVNSKYAEILHK